MVAAFQRFFIPSTKLMTAQGIIFNPDGQGIRMQWTITRDNTPTPDTGEVVIFNLSPALSGAIYEAWSAFSKSSGYLVDFGIGWERLSQTVIRGDVWRFVPAKRTPTDVLSIFSIGDGIKNVRDQATGASFSKVDLGTVLTAFITLPPNPGDTAGGGLGLLYPPESKALVSAAAAALKVRTFNNIPAGYNTRTFIDFAMATLGLEWRVHNGAFVVMRGGISDRLPPILAPRTGLIEYQVRDDGGIDLSALANPDVEPGVQVLVQDDRGVPFGAPAYRVDKVIFTGDTTAESLMQVSASKALI